jgi:hypothetical protein
VEAVRNIEQVSVEADGSTCSEEVSRVSVSSSYDKPVSEHHGCLIKERTYNISSNGRHGGNSSKTSGGHLREKAAHLLHGGVRTTFMGTWK